MMGGPAKHLGSINASPESPTYRQEMQKKGFSVPPADVPRPMKANPVSKQDPGLGAATIPHPFKAGKPTI
jgi:hypothetical protein